MEQVFNFFVILIVAILIFLAFLPAVKIAKPYFDNQLIVEVTHNGSPFTMDQVSFVFEEPGNYLVTILPISQDDKIPNSFAITVGANDAPLIKIIKKWSINDMTIIISKDGLSESHNFIYPY